MGGKTWDPAIASLLGAVVGRPRCRQGSVAACWGSPRWQGLCSRQALLWAISDFVPRSEVLGTPQAAGVMCLCLFSGSLAVAIPALRSPVQGLRAVHHHGVLCTMGGEGRPPINERQLWH